MSSDDGGSDAAPASQEEFFPRKILDAKNDKYLVAWEGRSNCFKVVCSCNCPRSLQMCPIDCLGTEYRDDEATWEPSANFEGDAFKDLREVSCF